MPSIFECINARAEAKKAERWASYIPLTRQQLSNSDKQPETLKEDGATVTLDVGVFGQFVVLKRPTEGAALRMDSTRDKIALRRHTVDQRWCIWCKCRHPEHDFLRHKRYLHGLSYACKKAINESRRRPWQHLSDYDKISLAGNMGSSPTAPHGMSSNGKTLQPIRPGSA